MAVVSQPNNRTGSVPVPGKLDASLGEFWSNNPWEIVRDGHNLSAFERNRVYLNVKGKNFVEVSHLSGADSDGDGRAVVAADFRNIGMNDLLVRQVGGGALLLYQNNLPKKSYLKVSLRGQTSNRQGIGARLIATINGQDLVRELYPYNTYSSQTANLVHFGLGEANKVERLTIQWPSGKKHVLLDVAGNRHIVVDESKETEAAIATITPGKPIAP